jgi:hypothetical protein
MLDEGIQVLVVAVNARGRHVNHHVVIDSGI